MPKICGIYCMENIINNKKYIGQTVNLEKRTRDHFVRYKLEKNIHLRASIDKYGIDNFKMYLLEECDRSELDEREIYYISKYQSTDRRFGYNILKGGNRPPSFLGKSHLPQTKQKIAKSAMGNTRWLGRHHTEETKEKKSKLASGDRHYFFGKKRSNSSSKYFGVMRYTNHQRQKSVYRAKVSVNGKIINICQSSSELKCAIAYNEFVLRNRLPNPLNIIDKDSED